MGKLDDKVALITGSGRNIGRAAALKFAEEGADIIVNARSNREEAEAVAEEVRALGRRALPILADVSNKDRVDSMVKMALDEFGRIDILLNNAAIRPHKPFLELTLEDWEYVRGVVLDGAFYCTHAVMPSMVENNFGRVLFFTGDGAWGGRRRAGPCFGCQDGTWWAFQPQPGDRVCAPQRSGERWYRRAASTPAEPTRSGTPAAVRPTRRASPWAARARPTKSPPPASSWSATTAGLSPGKRCT